MVPSKTKTKFASKGAKIQQQEQPAFAVKDKRVRTKKQVKVYNNTSSICEESAYSTRSTLGQPSPRHMTMFDTTDPFAVENFRANTDSYCH